MFHLLSTIVLSPFLLIQGRRVRNNIIKLPEPVGKREGQIGEGDDLHLLVLGDSSAAGVGVEKQQDALLGQITEGLKDKFNVHFQLNAVSGATTKETMVKLESQPDGYFDVILVSLGVNDITSKVSRSQFTQQQQTLVKQLNEKFSPNLIIFSGLPPVGQFPGLPQPLRWYLGQQAIAFDNQLKEIVKSQANLAYINVSQLDNNAEDMASDGFHPGKSIYQQWAISVVAEVQGSF